MTNAEKKIIQRVEKSQKECMDTLEQRKLELSGMLVANPLDETVGVQLEMIENNIKTLQMERQEFNALNPIVSNHMIDAIINVIKKQNPKDSVLTEIIRNELDLGAFRLQESVAALLKSNSAGFEIRLADVVEWVDFIQFLIKTTQDRNLNLLDS